MIHCIVTACTWKAAEFHRLYDHLNKFHGALTKYACNIGRCTRTFGLRASFIRHFNSHFKNTDNTSNSFQPHETQLISPTPVNNRPDNASQQHVSVPDHDLLAIVPNLESNVQTPVNQFPIQDELVAKMEMMNLELSLKWLDISSMPRGTVFDLKKDLHERIYEPFHQVFAQLATIGLVTPEGRKVLDDLVCSLGGDESEHLFKKKLQKLDLYHDAREFVISNHLQPGVVRNELKMDNDPITGEHLI